MNETPHLTVADLPALFANGARHIDQADLNTSLTYLYPTDPNIEGDDEVSSQLEGNLLSLAFVTQDEDTVLSLLDRGADPRSWSFSREGWFGWDELQVFPIELAIRRNMPKVAKRLIDMGAVDWMVCREKDSDEYAGQHMSDETLGEQVFHDPDAVAFLATLGVINPAIKRRTPYRFGVRKGNSDFLRARRESLNRYAYHHRMDADAFKMRLAYAKKIAAHMNLDLDNGLAPRVLASEEIPF